MSRLGSFISGAFVGAVLVFVGLKYHVLRTNEGVQLVPKVAANFSDAYVDIRKFGIADWNQHKPLVAALVKSGKQSLMGESAASSLQDEAEQVLDKFGWKRPDSTNR